MELTLACFVAAMGVLAAKEQASTKQKPVRPAKAADKQRRTTMGRSKWYLVMKGKRLIAGFSGGADPLQAARRCADRNGAHIIVWEY